MQKLDLETGDMMRLFQLDGRYNKKQEVFSFGSSNVHQHVRPPAGVNYVV